MHQRIKELQIRTATRQPYSDMAVGVDGKLSVDKDERIIKGYLAVWGIVDTFGTRFVKGCFAKSLSARGVGSNAKQKILYLWQHDMKDPIGQFRVLQEDDYGLYFEAEIDDVPSGNRALTQTRSGTINQNSFGFDYVWDKVEYNETDDAIDVFEAVLHEGSAVTFGSNSETYMMRSPEEITTAKEVLAEEVNEFASELPHKQRVIFKQLMTRHISIANAEAQSKRLDQVKEEQKDDVIDYTALMNNY